METTNTKTNTDSSASGKPSTKATSSSSPYFRRGSIVGGGGPAAPSAAAPPPTPTSTSSSSVISPEKITSSNSSISGGVCSNSAAGSNSNSTKTSKYFRGSASSSNNSSVSASIFSDSSSSSSSSSSSVHGCVQSLGPAIFTWTSSTNRKRRSTIRTDNNTNNTTTNNSEGICQPCQEIIDDARKQFNACPLFRHHMDGLLSKDNRTFNNEEKGPRCCCCMHEEQGTEQKDSTSCAVRIGQEMKHHAALRHLCRQQCYLRSFAPVRDWTIMRKALYRQLKNDASGAEQESDYDSDSDSDADNDGDSGIKTRISKNIDELLKGWTCRLVHPDDDSDDCDDDDGSNHLKQKRRRTRKRRKIKDVTVNAPTTEFISPTGTRFQSAALVVRHIIMTTIRPPDYKPTKNCLQNQVKERKRRRLVFVGRLSHSESSSTSLPSSRSPSPSTSPTTTTISVSSDQVLSRSRPIKPDNTQISSSCPSSLLPSAVGSVHSPLGLLEELFPNDPWRLLLCTIFLNRTQRKQVDSLFCQFLDRWPDAESVVDQSLDDTTTTQLEEQIATLLLPMGLRHKRSKGIIRFCHDYVAMILDKNSQQQYSTMKIKQERRGDDHHDVRPPTVDDCDMTVNDNSRLPPEFTLTRKEIKTLFFCGDYAADAYLMFIRRDFSAGLKSNDHALVAYSEYQQTGKRLLLAKHKHK